MKFLPRVAEEELLGADLTLSALKGREGIFQPDQ
jgi:hypothetical protein